MIGGPGSIAVIGDLHSAWDDDDVRYFNDTEYALYLFTGDLGASTRQDGAKIVTSISRLQRDALIMPGNNDAPQYAALAAELAYRQGAKALLREPDAPAALTQLCGYSSHPFPLGPGGVTIIAGRPFSMGGPELTFARELEREFGVSSLDQSTERIVALAEHAPTRDLILLSHNGPLGLGSSAQSLWGRDFADPSADWGDRDLAQALARITAKGQHRVLAVIAGHMHSPTRDGAERVSEARHEGALYLNPARVPRIFQRDGRETRHHVALAWHDGALTATPCWVQLE